MKVIVLTSSRADYSIYYPLLCKLKEDPFFDLSIVAFGTHLSRFHGNTIEAIRKDGFAIEEEVDSMVAGDSPEAISSAIGLTTLRFTDVWKKHRPDLIICLGDRYEMFAAVFSSLPFNYKVAHIAGGEVTLGAIDNVYRDSLTSISDIHFTSASQYKKRVEAIKGADKHVFNVGSLSYDNLKNMPLWSKEELEQNLKVSFEKPTALVTVHPETFSYEENIEHIKNMLEAIENFPGIQFLFTMPNADTMGNYIRAKINEFAKSKTNIFTFESLGTIRYLSCMKHCAFMLGNTSSGFVEASFFPKWVINVGNRQEGRIQTSNIIKVPFQKNAIVTAVQSVLSQEKEPDPVDTYGVGNSAESIVRILKEIF